MNTCQLCNRNIEILTKHHLIPKSRKLTKNTIYVCLTCKDMIHKLISNKELEKKYYTIDLLKNNEKIKKYINWIKNKIPDRLPIASKKKKK